MVHLSRAPRDGGFGVENPSQNPHRDEPQFCCLNWVWAKMFAALGTAMGVSRGLWWNVAEVITHSPESL
jgi:hypothetical protein